MDFMAQRSATHLNFWPYELFDLDSGTRSYLQSFDPNVDDDPYDFRTGFDTPGFISKGSSTERSEEHTSELQSLMRIQSAVFCLKKQKKLLNKNKQDHH